MADQPTSAIGYILRCSPDKSDTGSKTAIATQRICTYCQFNGITLVDMLVDDGMVERRLDERPTLRAALSALAAGRADALIVLSLPSLSRSICELAPWLAEHFGEGSRHALIAVHERIDTRKATGRQALGVLSALSLFAPEGRHA